MLIQTSFLLFLGSNWTCKFTFYSIFKNNNYLLAKWLHINNKQWTVTHVWLLKVTKPSNNFDNCILITDIVVLDHCYFPVFLQSQQQNGRLQPWVTRSWWINMENNPRMREQREIYVDGSYMMVTLKENSLNCERKNRRFTPYKESKPRQNCQTRQNYNRTCLYQEGNKYRVAQYDEKRYDYFTTLCFLAT